jgi:undecaprenyl-diphosphatase
MNNLVLEKNKKLIFFAFLSTVICFVLGYIVSNGLFSFDFFVHSKMLSLRNDALTPLMIFITNIASPIFLQIYTILIFSILVALNKFNDGINFVVSMFVGAISFFSIKEFFEISRPLEKITNVSGWGFPSGHTTLATVAFLLTIFFLKDSVKNNFYKKIFIEFFALIIVLIALSRVYLGAHFFSDVLGGFFLGLAIVFVSVIFARSK